MATTASISLNMDCFTSPYYLPNSDSPSTMLVPRVMTRETYHNWSRLMQMALKVNNKIVFVKCSFIQPRWTNSSHEIWEMLNLYMIYIILSFIKFANFIWFILNYE